MTVPKQVFIAIFSLLFVVSTVNAQQLKGGRKGKSTYNTKRTNTSYVKRNKTDLFPLEREYRLGGFYVAPGITYMWPEKDGETTNEINDTSYNYANDPSGKIGLYLELGWFHSFVNPMPFHFIDFGLAYKQLKGEEALSLSASDAGQQFNTGETVSEFNDKFLALHLNATHQHHFSRYGFIHNTIGINYDFNIGKDRSDVVNFNGLNQQFPGDQVGQIHYKIGIGWKASSKILVVPSLETPIFTFQEFDGFKSRLTYFSSKYRPFILSVKIFFIRTDLENCNVPNYDGPSNFE